MKLSELNKLTFSPKEGDVITCAIPMCAPYSAIQVQIEFDFCIFI